MRETTIVYEVRVAGAVLASFSDEKKAKREMKKLRKEGHEARIYTRWIPVSEKLKEKNSQTKKRETKPKPKPAQKTKRDFREGWYLLSGGFLVFVQRSEEPLEPELMGNYECYIDYSVILPQDTGYDMDGGLVAYDGQDIRDFINRTFGTDGCEFVDVDDPYTLREAFESNDIRTITQYVRKHPKIWVF